VAFGVFNINTNMILLDHYFFFAERFCNLVTDLARQEKAHDFRSRFQAYSIGRPEGGLAGAIHGVRYQEFIGAVYRDFPFPRTHEEFEQKPDGSKHKARVAEIIRSYAVRRMLPFLIDSETLRVTVGGCEFDRKSFGQLVRYLWEGGAPGWRNDVRPPYIAEMMREIARTRNAFFRDEALQSRRRAEYK